MGDAVMENRKNYKGGITQRTRDVSRYMKRHYFKLWIDQFEEKPIQIFIDAEGEENAEQKLKSKIRWEKIKRTPRA